MAKQCETFDHPADVGLRARADTLPELLEALAEGLADILCDRSTVLPTQSQSLAVAAEDVEALTVDFLAAVASIAQTDHLMIASVAVAQTGPAAVAANVRGEPYDPARHEIHTEIKAVTYHQLTVRQENDLWTARVILDL